jgi:hypothetical protein
VETEPEFSESSFSILELIGFYSQIKEISLCVDIKNSNVTRLYKKVGLEELHRCVNFGINTK